MRIHTRYEKKNISAQKKEALGDWKKLYEELQDLYYWPNIMRVIKSRRMRWAGHVARKGRAEVHTGSADNPDEATRKT